ncbi:leucine-rich repeat-containing protein 45 [Ambystoma mexicanum]|uniref:leucine-rich repeat-containing protein 45 n=1 Tax=Ambystoma mexicanum TaxID=8296 RepID=UPI0037E70B8D
MEEFRRSFIRLCKEGGFEPQETVLKQLHELRDDPGGRGRLDFSTLNLSVESSDILGRLLQNDIHFTDILLSDCMLSEEGVKLLLHGLCSNSVVKRLDLKGNNLRAVGAEALGKLLRQNKSIRSLTLEWNNLGMWEDSFSLFCEGLGSNHFLQQLDLRNNQINHQGAGELAVALNRNSSLQDLDLRWNNIGLLGSRSLLNSLHNNKTMGKLELSGNNIPSDILKAIEQAIEHNHERQSTQKENRNRTQILSKEVSNLKEEKTKQFLDLMEAIDKQREEFHRSSRTSAVRVGHLQEVLDERKSAVNSLRAKLQMTEASLALSEQKVQDLGELLSHAKQENFNLKERQAKDLKQEKEETASIETKLLREMACANEKNLNLQSKVEELERKCKSQQDRLFELKQELTNTSTELKLRAIQAEERLDAEKKRFKQTLEDSDNLRQKEVDHMARHVEESERSLQERIQRLEATRIALEEELSRVKAACVAERSRAEEEVMKAKNLARLEEQQKVSHLEEKLRQAIQSRDDAHNSGLLQKQELGDAKAKNHQLTLEIEGLKHRLHALEQDLAGKDREAMAQVNKVRMELEEQIGHLQAERTAQEGLKETIAALQRQLKAQTSSHRESVLDKESEIASLLEKLRLKDADIQRMREEEAQRTSFLHNAILSYVHSSPVGLSSPRK